MFFRDMSDELFDELHSRNGLVDQDIIFMSVVMEGNCISSLIVRIDTRSGNYGTAEVASDVLQNSGGIALVVFGVNVEAVFRVAVNGGFEAFEFWRKFLLEKIQEDGLEGIAKEGIVEVRNRTPKTELIDTAFGDKAVNVRIPL